jgi:cytochrome c oxidase cbb3-type subunit 3
MNMLSADMPSAFWAGWIAIITLVSLAGLIWMLISVYFVSDKDAEHELPTWDEDLREGTKEPPIWWFWMLLALLVISDIYLILYPGLGRFEGALKWSQAGRLSIAEMDYREHFAGVRNLVKVAPLETLQKDAALMTSARHVFVQNCAACHGSTARGQANRFPNLTNGNWQWGGDPAQLEQSIRFGRQAVMPGWQAVLGDAGVQDVVQYVRALSQAGGPPAEHPGKAHYQQTCIACHAADGTGNVALGAPDLTTGIWLYGGSDADLTQTIAEGRIGIMPAFGERLDEVQMRMLIAWLDEMN